MYKNMGLFFFMFVLLNSYGILALNVESSHLRSNEKGNIDGMDNESNNRGGKIFSLFSIVQFKNEACRSSQTLQNTASSVSRNGTCYSSTECRDKSGQAAGSCAAGFGVCCVFVYERTGGTISQNCSYIRNPGYPNALTDTAQIQFNVVKCDPSVCYLRLDFENFDINGLTASDENDMNMASGAAGAHMCTDKFTITSAADPNLPTICGKNTGQHVYVDMGTAASDTTTLAFEFTDSTLNSLNNNRNYEIKVTQLPCSNEYNGYAGCFQYHEGLTGRVETFNFENCGPQSHLPNQDYSICVRPEAGYDCVRWQLCPDVPCGSSGDIVLPAVDPGVCRSFSVGDDNILTAVVAKNCNTDLIRLNGATTQCCTGTAPGATQDAFCGSFLNIDPTEAAVVSVPLCDCTPPYNLDIYFDAFADIADPTMADPGNTKSSCGLCLIYDQVRC